MKFTPKTEKELKEAMLWPAGEYDFEVLESSPAVGSAQSKNPGLEYIKLKLRVFNQDGATKLVNAVLHPKMEWAMRAFCYETGIENEYESGELSHSDCVGKTGKVQLKIKQAEGDFPAKNEVGNWGAKEEKKKLEAKPAASKQPANNSDDVPF